MTKSTDVGSGADGEEVEAAHEAFLTEAVMVLSDISAWEIGLSQSVSIRTKFLKRQAFCKRILPHQ